MDRYSRVRAEVDLDAFAHNLDEIERIVGPDTKVAAVIKTDGYGHGAVPLAGVLEPRQSVWGYAVATAAEGIELREAGFQKPILILGYSFPEVYEDIAACDLSPTVFSLETAGQLSAEAQKQGKTLRVHIKLDTGMSRIGYQAEEKNADEIAQIAALPNIMIEGVFTHFAKADERDKRSALEQAAAYERMLGWLAKRGVAVPIRHISNSAGIIDLPGCRFDMVRAGIILYGLWPSDEVQKETIDLRPVLSLKSRIVHVKTLPAGRTVSYGGTYELASERVIATIPVGYGDGYPRSLSNRGYVLIGGKRAPIVGRVCMDQFMTDVTDIPGVKAGDEATLVGADGDERITMEELGDLSGRFNYEFACCLGKRIPRVYYRGGKPVSGL